jgi:23S rRNA (pseudouridine1915-N3)-methyltransferase
VTRIAILAVGERPPAWVETAVAGYLVRIPKSFAPRVIEIAPGRQRRAGDVARAVIDEGERVLAAVPADARLVLLDERGESWRSNDLAKRLATWSHESRPTMLAIGGPDGHAEAVRKRADFAWSLSALTLPHALVRVVLAEQLYRAWSINAGHPYHRE